MTNQNRKRYSPLWVSLHWLIALLLGAVFILGFSTRNASFETYPTIINWHMFLGSSVLLLMLGRILIRSRSPRPELADAGPGTDGPVEVDRDLLAGILLEDLLVDLALAAEVSRDVGEIADRLGPGTAAGAEQDGSLDVEQHTVLDDDPLLGVELQGSVLLGNQSASHHSHPRGER